MPQRNNILLSVPENNSLGSFTSPSRLRGGGGNRMQQPSPAPDPITGGMSIDQIRQEVATIFQNVLPDEIDHVDNWLLEYQGREDQLLKTLHRMEASQQRHNNNESTKKKKSSISSRRSSNAPVDPDDFIMDETDNNYGGGTKTTNGGHVSFDVDEWQQDLNQQIDDHTSHRSHSRTSNPQGGGGRSRGSGGFGNGEEEGQLKSPPEQLLGEANYFAEEKKNDSHPQHHHNNHHDEDENDVPFFPDVVRTNSMGYLKVSNLTSDEQAFADEQAFDEDQDSNSTGKSSLSTPKEDKGKKKAMALVKLRVWDPANPQRRMKCLTVTHILLPNQKDMDEASSQTNSTNGSSGLATTTFQRKESESSKSRKSKSVKRLSIVKEEPDMPPGRGESYFDDGNGIFSEMSKSIRDPFVEDDDDDDDDDNEVDQIIEDWEDSRTALCVGTLVGIQLKTSSSSSSSKQQLTAGGTSIASSVASLKRNYEWKVGNSINMHKVNLLPLANLSQLHYQMENNFSSLRELVMDGLPPMSFNLEEAELIFEALGVNSSIRRLSMRYSNVDDDLGSLFALALVDNTALTQLSLEGNDITNVSAKNFYSVLTKNNETLRLLDISKNPLIDGDVEQALDQFMEQRSLKRTLTNKAEKAKRAARGMPPDTALDEDDDEGGGGQVTVVCPQSAIDTVLGSGDTQYHEQNDNDDASGTSGAVKPYPGEKFGDYMQRMDQMKESSNQSPSYNQTLMEDSIREGEAFDNYAATESFSLPRSQHQVPLSPDDVPQNPYHDADGHDSTGSSITTRSTHKRGNEQAIVTTSNEQKNSFEPNKAVKFAEEAETRKARAPPKRWDSIETQESMSPSDRRPRSLNRSDTLETVESADANANGDSSGPGAHPYHNTQVSKGSNPSLDISQEDYMDDKVDERAMRHQLATAAGAIGAFHIDEAAPSRQNRARGRRLRQSRTESQRRARLAELRVSATGTEITPATGEGSGVNDITLDADIALDADIERADEMMYRMPPRRKSRLSVIGFDDDEDAGMDKIVLGILAVLLVGLVVMIILIVM